MLKVNKLTVPGDVRGGGVGMWHWTFTLLRNHPPLLFFFFLTLRYVRTRGRTEGGDGGEWEIGPNLHPPRPYPQPRTQRYYETVKRRRKGLKETCEPSNKWTPHRVSGETGSSSIHIKDRQSVNPSGTVPFHMVNSLRCRRLSRLSLSTEDPISTLDLKTR